MRNYNFLHKELKVLNINDSIEFEQSKFMFKIINNLISNCIKSEFQTQPPSYNTNRNVPRIQHHNSNIYNISVIINDDIF